MGGDAGDFLAQAGTRHCTSRIRTTVPYLD